MNTYLYPCEKQQKINVETYSLEIVQKYISDANHIASSSLHLFQQILIFPIQWLALCQIFLLLIILFYKYLRKYYPPQNTMMHHAQFVYRSVTTQIPNKDRVTKFNGSYFQQPLIEHTLNTNNVEVKHVFKSICQDIKSQQYNLQWNKGLYQTMKIINIGKYSLEEKKLFRKHYRIDIKNYMKRKYNKPAYLIPLEAFETVRQIIPNQKNVGENLIFKTDIICIFKPFYLMNHLKYLLDSSPKAISKSDMPHLARSIVSCGIRHGGLSNFLMTSSNLYIEENFQQFAINHTSFVGLNFLNGGNNSTIRTISFFEIYPHLSSKILQQGIMPYLQNGKIAKYSKIKSTLVNILNLFVKRDLYFDITDNQTDLITKDKAKIQIKKLPGHFEAVLNEIKGSKKSYMKIMKGFFEDRFSQVQALQKMSALDKQKVAEKNKEKQQLGKLRGNKFRQLFEKVLIRQQIQVSWEQLIDVIYRVKDENNQDSVITNDFKKFHEYMWSKQEDKKFFEERGLDGLRLYVPIKLNAEIHLILQYENWWLVFEDDKFNFQHTGFCFKLLKALIQKHKEDKSQQILKNKVYVAIQKYLQKGQYQDLYTQTTEDEKQAKTNLKPINESTKQIKMLENKQHKL